jgi:predicted amidohydrolase YtcJ
VLLQRGGHNGVLNSAGLSLAGIGRDTPDPEGGFIDRDAAGDPRGWVQDAALELAQRALPPLPEQALIGGLGQASASYAAHGIGTVRDAAVTPAQWHAYVRAQADGQLAVRCHAMIMTTPAAVTAAGSVDAYLDSLEEQGIRPGAGDGLLRAWGLKFVLDGGVEAAAMTRPYHDRPGAGAWISAGTDHPIGPLSPLRAVSGMTTRATPAGVLGPEHAITREEALRLYTVAGARFLGGQASRRTCPGEQLAALSPAVTVIDGRLAYRAG